MTRLAGRVVRKARSGLSRLRWWLWLRRRVSGRIKLRGDLGGLTVAPTFRCDGDLWLGIYSDEGRIRIGADVSASGPLVITAIRDVEVGDGVLFGPNVFVTDHLHGDPKEPATLDTPPSDRPLHSRGAVRIDDFAHIGANVVVLSPAHVGRRAIVGANSVVAGPLSARTIHAGAPARPVAGARAGTTGPIRSDTAPAADPRDPPPRDGSRAAGGT